MFRIIEMGGKIATPGVSILVRRLAEMIADRGARAPASLLDLSMREWCQQSSGACTAAEAAASTGDHADPRQLLTR